MHKKNILITGPPRCGKSTVIEGAIKGMPRPVRGFFTAEIKEKGKRVGFSITTVDGRKGILAHQGLQGTLRIGRYVINPKDIEQIAVPSMVPSCEKEIIVIDEIGKMECLSSLFREALLRALVSPNRVIGSIAERGDRFIETIKARNDVKVIRVTAQNRGILANELVNYIKEKS
jgi:nucleoside-triphosphatase